MFEQAFKNIDDVLWKDAGCTSELDYTEQTSCLRFPTHTWGQRTHGVRSFSMQARSPHRGITDSAFSATA